MAGLLLAAAGCGRWRAVCPGDVPHGPEPAPAASADPRQHPALTATQWMQAAAEYEALCRQVYAQARQAVAAAAAETSAEAATTTSTDARPPAVVMDLDETVIDNGWYQARRMRRGLSGWDPAEWTDYCNNHWDEGRAVPGAVEFIQWARREGLAVFFITNRNEAERPGTARTLEMLGVGEADYATSASRHLLMRTATGNKDARRDQVAARHRIVALIGDNLGDMSGVFDKSPALATGAQRRELVRRNADRFGTQWFVLPNPLYGEWEKFLDRDDVLADLYQ